jgi:Fe-S cluster assembly protein SufD
MNELSVELARALPLDGGDGPEWLTSLRRSAAEHFRSHGLPSRRDEAWKYTGLHRLEQAGLKMGTGFESWESGLMNPGPLVETDIRINMLDGQFLELVGEPKTGLTIMPLATALRDDSRNLKVLLESLEDTRMSGSGHGFSALNSATLDAGLLIHVAAGVDAGQISLNWSTRALDAPLLFNSRVCIILESRASLALVEQFESPGENCNSSNVVVQAVVGQKADLSHVRFQQENEEAAIITRTVVRQDADSSYHYYGFDLGGGLVRHDLHADLLEPGAKADLNGAYLLDGNRHVDNHSRVDHRAPGGTSDQYFRGVAGGRGRAVFNTAVCVHPGADETEATQSNANILLSAQAEVDTKPELEIYADEVVASHGATVGQLDEQAVFYLRSRGLGETEARHILTSAFCRSVSDRIPDRALGEVIAERMMDIMPHSEQGT